MALEWMVWPAMRYVQCYETTYGGGTIYLGFCTNTDTSGALSYTTARQILQVESDHHESPQNCSDHSLPVQ